jgi:hypothetical protein
VKDIIKKWAFVALGLGIIIVGFIRLDASQSVQVSAPGYASASVPAPRPGQKKVILKNLGMT